MLETSTFGLPQGSLFAQLGSDETFQAAPDILKQHGDYTSAVFHGNNAAFWNRNNTYKNMGYDYFYDASYYDTTGDRATGYGLKISCCSMIQFNIWNTYNNHSIRSTLR